LRVLFEKYEENYPSMTEALHDQAQDTQYLRERTADITEELRAKLSPALGGVAFDVFLHGKHFYNHREIDRDFYSGNYVPYRFASIPPDFFGSEQPHTFDSEEVFNRHVANYWRQDDARAEAEARIGYGNGGEPELLWSERARKAVAADLGRVLLRPTETLDFSDWDEYSRADMVLQGRTFMLNCFFTAHVYSQATKTGFFEYFKDQTEAALIRSNILLGNASVTSIARSPILQNDHTLTNRLLNAGLHTAIVAGNDEIALERFGQLLESDDNRELFHRHVQRASRHGGTPDRDYGPDRLAHMATELFMTVSGTFSLMAQESPDGYPHDGYRLISDLAEQNMIDKFTRLVPFGFVGPATLFGRYIPGLLYATPDEQYEYKLRFNPDALKRLREFAERVEANHVQQWREYDEKVKGDPSLLPPVQTGGRCPFSGKVRNDKDPSRPINGAVSMYADAIAFLFKTLNLD
jgi:hypothetical protein